MTEYSLESSSSAQTVPFSFVSGNLDQLNDLRGLEGCGTVLGGLGGGKTGGGAGADGGGGATGGGGGGAGAAGMASL